MSGLEILGGIASSIALAQAVQRTLKAVDFLRKNSDIRKECNALKKEILMIECFILQAREQTDPMRPAQQLLGTFTEHPLVSLTTQELEEILEELNSIVEKYSHSRKPHDPKRYTDKVKWFSEVRKIEELRERAKATKLNLHMAITFRVSSMVDRGNMRQEVLFHRVTQQLTCYTREARNESPNLLQLLEAPPLVSGRLATAQQTWEEDFAIRGMPSTSISDEENVTEIISPSLTSTTEQGVVAIKEETLVSVTTIQPFGSRTCGPGCECRCHRTRREHNGGTWAKFLFGSWLVRYEAIGVPCQGKCGSNSGVEIEYQLPKWLWAGMITLEAYQGPRITWSLRLSRTISKTDCIWEVIRDPSVLRRHIAKGFVCFPDDTTLEGRHLMWQVVDNCNVECIEILLKLWENLLSHQGLAREVGYNISYNYLINGQIEYGDPLDTIFKKILSFVRDWDDVRTTKVHRAVKEGNGGLAQALQEEPWAIDERDEYGKVPIQYAVSESNLEALDYLIMAKANINRHDLHGQLNLLALAALHGKEAMIRRLLDHDECRRDLNEGTRFGNTALHMAAHGLYAECARLLLSAGASTSVSGEAGHTSMHSIVLAKNPEKQAVDEVVHLLKDHGADLEAKDEDGDTPAMLAILSRNQTALHALVGAGASLGTINLSQRNVLHLVARRPEVDIIEYLADQDLDHVDSQHQDVLRLTPLGLLDNLLGAKEWQTAYDINRTDPSVQEVFIKFYFNLLSRDLMRHMSTLRELLRAVTDRDMSTSSNIIDQLIKKKTEGNDPNKVKWYRGVQGYVVEQAWDCLSEIVQEEYEETSEQLERAYIAKGKEISADEMKEFF
ncbi:hypothetical protein NW762_008867 [Fusarium torreyae]|uniref:Uncharacterized protein n=1 Tax=Fusarium torreyae TaxID=1237075 RepID=A0A9W8VEV4_9HYPO|nr:hypothetical protein NW762_008867 [Fusarium torreyae]